MPTVAEHEAHWREQPESQRDEGKIHLLVLRKGGGVHETPESIELCPRRGVVDDRWTPDSDPDCQVTLMNVHVARTIAGDQPLHLPGDNVLVDLDLGETSLPVGSRLHVGSALLEISPTPHTGCGKFASRFGTEALQWVNGKQNRARRLRGVNCVVVEGGRAALGDPVRVALRVAST